MAAIPMPVLQSPVPESLASPTGPQVATVSTAEVEALLAMSPDERPLNALNVLSSTIQALNATAMTNSDPAVAYDMLKTAGQISSYLQPFAVEQLEKRESLLEAFFEEQAEREKLGDPSAAAKGSPSDAKGGLVPSGGIVAGNAMRPLVASMATLSDAAMRHLRPLLKSGLGVQAKFCELEVLRLHSLIHTSVRDVCTKGTQFAVALEHGDKGLAYDSRLLQEVENFKNLQLQHEGAKRQAQESNDFAAGWSFVGEAGSFAPPDSALLVSPQRRRSSVAGIKQEASGELRAIAAGANEAQLLQVQTELDRLTPIHFAKGAMTICVLLGRNKRHNEAAKKANRAVLILKGVIKEVEQACRETEQPIPKQSEAHELMVMALYNLATQLEQCGKTKESALHYADAAELALTVLGKQHELTRQLLAIASRGDAPKSIRGGGTSGGAAVLMASGGRPTSSNDRMAVGSGASAARRSVDLLPMSAAQPPRTAPVGARRPSRTSASVEPRSSVAAAHTRTHTPRRGHHLPSLQTQRATTPRGGSREPSAAAAHEGPASARQPSRKSTTAGGGNVAITHTGVALMDPTEELMDPALGPQQTAGLPSSRSVSSPSRLPSQQPRRGSRMAWGTAEVVSALDFSPPPAAPPTDAVPDPDDDVVRTSNSGPMSTLAAPRDIRTADTLKQAPAPGQAIDLTAAVAEANSNTQRSLAGSSSLPPLAPTSSVSQARAPVAAQQTLSTTSALRTSNESSFGTQSASRYRSPGPASAAGSIRSGVGASSSRRRKADKLDELMDRTRDNQERFFDWMSSVTDRLFGEYAHRDRAAATIQRAWRSAKARVEAHNRRQIFYYFLHCEQKAATACIVARYKTFAAQKRLHKQKNATAARQASRVEQERKEHEAALCLTRNLRLFVEKKKREQQLMRQLQLVQEGKLQQYDAAAVIIQRWWPIIKVEKQYWVRRNEEVRQERLAEERRLRHERAATNIGRVWRGCMGRRYAVQYREQRAEEKRRLQQRIGESIDVLRIVLKEHRARQRRLEAEALKNEFARKEAALKIQLSWYSALQRRALSQLHSRARMLNREAAIIQRCFKRYRARRELRVLKAVEKTTRISRINDEMREQRAATTIQCAARVMFALRQRRKIMASSGRKMLLATWLHQRVGRGYLERLALRRDQLLKEKIVREAINMAVAERHRCVALVQASMRQRYSTANVVNAMVRDIEAEDLLIRRRARREMRDDKAATQIQRIVRGRQGRAKAAAVRDSLEVEKAVVIAAIIRIQCFFRKILAKRTFVSRQIDAMQKLDKKRLWQDVHNELFATRAEELDRLQDHQRRRIITAEVEKWLVLTGGHLTFKRLATNAARDLLADVEPTGTAPQVITAEQSINTRRPLDATPVDSGSDIGLDDGDNGIYD